MLQQITSSLTHNEWMILLFYLLLLHSLSLAMALLTYVDSVASTVVHLVAVVGLAKVTIANHFLGKTDINARAELLFPC